MRRIIGWMPAVLLAVCLTAPAAPKDQMQTLGGFSVPQYNDQGQMTSQLFGELARFMADGLVDITQLKIEFYGVGTNIEMRVTSPQCIYDREKGAAKSESAVRIARDNMVVTGVGFVFNNPDQKFQILKDAKVVLKGLRKQMDTGEKK